MMCREDAEICMREATRFEEQALEFRKLAHTVKEWRVHVVFASAASKLESSAASLRALVENMTRTG